MRFYEVVAKCGHVGRQNYYEGHIFVRAVDKKHAARIVKRFPRVKKDHEDAILNIYEVDEPEYLKGVEEMNNNPYFNCVSKHEQNAATEFIQDGIRPETDMQLAYREKRCGKYYKDKSSKDKPNKRKGIRNPYKYAKYNAKYDYDDLYSA